MISVIICSANTEDLAIVKKNIAETIGVVHEIIAIDNRKDRRGICEVYNEGTRKAQYETLCYMHEDIELITKNWGVKVLELFNQNKKLGLIGIAGGGYKSLVPSSWYNADLEINGEFYCHLIQGFKYSGKEAFLDNRNPKNLKLARVATIDGCWMCTTKHVVGNNPFDQEMLKSFHAYDIDISLSIGRKFQVAITYEILMKHFSEGAFDESWEKEILSVHQKWSHLLPINTDNLNEDEMLKYERRAFKKYFNRQLDKGKPYSELIKIIWHARYSRLFSSGKLYKVYVDLWRVWKIRKLYS